MRLTPKLNLEPHPPFCKQNGPPSPEGKASRSRRFCEESRATLGFSSGEAVAATFGEAELDRLARSAMSPKPTDEER